MKYLFIIREGIKEILSTYLYLKFYNLNEAKKYEYYVLQAIEDASNFFNLEIDINDLNSIKEALRKL